MGPSTLFPSHDQTTFHDCPAARTPGIADGAGRTGSGGTAFVSAAWLIGIENGGGGVLHFARTSLIPGFCQLCLPLPRWKADDGLCAAAAHAKTKTKLTDDFTT